ncbi:pyridoxamine 5'-phosphate oxidase [archaeon BMS3Abin16]|nr:pyridoxamine 5'-phosphate oxidase [archaeon BMS3Abin16]
MEMSMTKEEVTEFLSQPILARIATVGMKGKPYIAPVWFIYEEGTLVISTGKDSVKVRNIKNNPAVAVDIDTTEGGFQSKGVIFRGKAEIDETNTTETAKRIYMKYLGSLDHPMAQQLLSMPRATIRLKPERTTSWDYAKIGG